MARPELADLREEVRLRISDPAGATAVFDDDKLDRFLDGNRRVRSYEQLRTSLEPDGRYLRYFAPTGWASDAVLHDSGYQVVPAADYDADFIGGIFTFHATRLEELLLVSGTTYSIYGAASEALRAWAASLKEEIDVSASGDSWSRSQKVRNLLELARTYDAKAQAEEISGSGEGGISTLRQVRRDSRNVRGERATRRRIG